MHRHGRRRSADRHGDARPAQLHCHGDRHVRQHHDPHGRLQRHDRTDPTVELRNPATDATYARGQTVAADFDCADDTGLAWCVGTVADGQPIDTSTLGRHSFTVTATDAAGNTTIRTVAYSVTDNTDPTIELRTPAADAGYARGQTVAADFDCADDTALASCVGTVADNAPIDTTTLGPHEFTVTATDAAGNTSTRSVSYNVTDRTDPTIELRTPAADAGYTRGQTVAADFDCADETALASCVGTVADNAPIDTATLGTHDFTVTATDTSGNTSTRSVSYSVTDRTDPTTELPAPTDGTKDGRGEHVAGVFACADDAGGSELASCQADRQGNIAAATYGVVAAPTASPLPSGDAPTPEVVRFGPRRWLRDPGGPRAVLTFREPTRARLLSLRGLAVGVDCRRRCRASVLLSVRGSGETVRVRARRLRLTADRRTLRLPIPSARIARLLEAGTLRVRITATVTDARGRRATLAAGPFTAADERASGGRVAGRLALAQHLEDPLRELLEPLLPARRGDGGVVRAP